MQGIRIGVGLGELSPGRAGDLASTLAQFTRAEQAGFQTAWVANIFAMDAMTLIALAARETKALELGTAVVPTFSRHPLYMAQQALTTQLVCGGRFVLGIGPSHKIVVENMLGLSYTGIAKHVEEYVQVVRALADTGKVAHAGSVYRVNGSLKNAARLPILIGGLGPRMRRIAGAIADGTITWMTGPRAIGEQLAPDITRAAAEAGRKDPVRIVCGLPTVVTNDAAGAREAASKAFALYGTLPSYRAMLDLERPGAAPGEVAIAGDERAVEQQIARLRDAGVTDFHAAIMPFGPDAKASAERTWNVLAELAKK